MGVCVSFNQHSSFVKSSDIYQGREKQTSGCVWLASARRVPAVFTPSAASPDDSASAVRRLHNGAARWGHGDRVTRGGGPVQHGRLPDHIAFSDGPLLLRASSHKHFINWDGLFCQYPRGSRSYFGAKISKHSRLRGRGHEMESSQAVWYVPAGDLSCKEGLLMTFKPQQINRGFSLAAFTDLKCQDICFPADLLLLFCKLQIWNRLGVSDVWLCSNSSLCLSVTFHWKECGEYFRIRL